MTHPGQSGGPIFELGFHAQAAYTKALDIHTEAVEKQQKVINGLTNYGHVGLLGSAWEMRTQLVHNAHKAAATLHSYVSGVNDNKQLILTAMNTQKAADQNPDV